MAGNAVEPLIPGIVLAAGRSRRMGQPKALLPAAGATFLERVASALREGGCQPLVVVVGPPSDRVAATIAALARDIGAQPVVNPDATSEQIDSLRTALRVLDGGADAAVVAPVDMPRVSASLVRRLIEAFRRTGAPVVVPVHDGSHGHPVLFARAAFAELMSEGLAEGARTVVRAHSAELAEVPVEDPSILEEVNTPAEYRSVFGAEP